MAEDHVATAKKAQAELIRQRRGTVEFLSKGYERGETERQMDLLLKYQDALAALDEVVHDEQRRAAQGAPKEFSESDRYREPDYEI